MTNFMDDNADVWIGATYWAAGPGWGDYMFSIEPTDLKTAGVNATDRAQMDILEKYDLEYTGTTLQAPPPAPGTTTGTALNDTLTGTAGADTILGLAGNDKLDGGAGADTLKGGAGNDSYYVDNAGDVIVEVANEGTDAVFSSVSYAIGAYVQTLTLTGTAAVNATGNELANTLAGNSAANTLSARAGSDKLNGNGGSDILTGGAGADTFHFDTAAETNGDRITDFAHGSDKVYLRAMDANPTLTGDQAFAFIGTGAFSGTAGQLRYKKGTADTIVSGDMNGDGVADFSITFTGLHTFSASDFTL
jgi:Ca2+-binding RTX toxin-like protein